MCPSVKEFTALLIYRKIFGSLTRELRRIWTKITVAAWFLAIADSIGLLWKGLRFLEVLHEAEKALTAT